MSLPLPACGGATKAGNEAGQASTVGKGSADAPSKDPNAKPTDDAGVAPADGPRVSGTTGIDGAQPTGGAATEPQALTQPWPICVGAGSASDEERIACMSPERVRAELEFVAKPRPPGSAHWKAVQDRCAQRFEQAGFAVQRVAFGEAEELQEGTEGIAGVNVIGTLPGTQLSDHIVLVGAHYDHITDCEGADDNGSGVAALLVLAEQLGRQPRARTIVVACWDQEESGLHGSFAHVEQLKQAGVTVDMAFVFDTMGVRKTDANTQRLPPGLDLLFPAAAKWIADRDNRGDFVAILGNATARSAAERFVAVSPRAKLLAQNLELPDALIGSPMAADLHRSDHANFWIEKMPALMLTDTANFRTETYHCRGAPDNVDSVDPAFVAEIAQTTTFVALELASKAP